MSKFFVTIALVTMILIMALPVRGLVHLTPKDCSHQTKTSPEQKISSYLKDQMTRNSASKDQPFRILIKCDPNARSALPKGLRILRDFKMVPLVAAQASSFEIEELAKLDAVEYIYPDLKTQALSYSPQRAGLDVSQGSLATGKSVPNTPWFGEYPCFLNESTSLIKANELWADDITGQGVVVAILDTGINKNHPDLDDMDDNPATCDPKVLAEQAFIEEPAWEVGDLADYVGHGTHCASIAAGTGGTGAMGFLGTYFGTQLVNGTILPGTERGVAPGAYLYNVKVLNSEGWGYDSWIIAGVEWAVEHGADVISMSIGGWPAGRPEEDPLAQALETAVDHGVVCVVAAGNSGWGYFSLDSPGFDPKVITVGASTETDQLVPFSSRGPEQFELHAKPDILAPGTCIVAAYPDFEAAETMGELQVFYMEMSGTSMATPHAAGAAALLLQAFPGATPYAVKSAMMLGADDLGLDAMAQGTGRLNVARAHKLMEEAPKSMRGASVPTTTIESLRPELTALPNLTGVRILVEDSFCNPMKMYTFINMLSLAGATVMGGSAPYSNASLVNSGTQQPLYDIFILPEPNSVSELALPPSVLAYYVRQNGTVLFTGDVPVVCKDYSNWTRQWGISWDNRAGGGFSTRISAHPITTGVNEIYFGSPVASLIINGSFTPRSECVAWDPLFPGVVVWQAQAPNAGKVVVLSDDGVLANQYLSYANNQALGFNIIKWFTNATNLYLSSIENPLIPPVESPHPYPSDASLWFPVTASGADWVSVHFDRIDVENGYDYVTIYDQFMNPVEYFTGSFEEVWTGPVFGDVLWIRLESDWIVEGWGFSADAYRYGTVSPSMTHEIGLGGTWNSYLIANSSFTASVNVQNFGNYTEDVMLTMSMLNGTGHLIVDAWNFANVTVAPRATASVEVTPDAVLNATTHCHRAGIHNYTFFITANIYHSTSGSPPYREIDYTNNMLTDEVAVVPKTERAGPNPLLSVITPRRIASTSAPLIAMYPNDFTLHNLTAFVSGGQLDNARFEITGNVTTIADFVDAKTFAKHYSGSAGGDWFVDLSPAYFTPNLTSVIGDTLPVGTTSAPAMLYAELQIYIAPDTSAGSYTGTVQLVNGTTVLASADLAFDVRAPRSKILWDDFFNDYRTTSFPSYWGPDCERLWGGAFTRDAGGSVGLFEWWKLVANAGFDVDSLHQQLYFDGHLGFFGSEMKDPMQVIAYGGYNTLFMDDVDYAFTFQQITVFQQLYETGKMNFAVMFNDGSDSIDQFTTNYGISNRMPNVTGISPSPSEMSDLLVTGIDKSHPIFNGVDNFTLSLYPYENGYFLRAGPFIWGEGALQCKGTPRGIATGVDDFNYARSGNVVAVNELQATPHTTSRMVVVSDGNMFESLEYEDYLIWINLYMIAGNNTAISKVDTDRFAVNMLNWLTPQFSNTAPQIDSATVTPNAVKIGETASVDLTASDKESDSLAVTIAVKKPDSTWNNLTASSVGGHWTGEFTADMDGVHRVYAVVTDTYGATTAMPIGTIEASKPPITPNSPPRISSVSISPQKVAQGQTVFLTIVGEDAEDGTPTGTNVTLTSPTGATYKYTFTNTRYANVAFNTTGMQTGVYDVHVLIWDSQGATTSATVGSFEVEHAAEAKPAAAEFWIEELSLGIGTISLVTLIAIALLIWKRTFHSTTATSTSTATPPA